MVSGDVVSGMSATGVVLIFQPAATVEIFIGSTSSWGSMIRLTDGVNLAFLNGSNSTTNGTTNAMKVFINNTHYLDMLSNASAGCWFSGIQIK
jgi:membrane glycosyltransferase